MNLNGIYRYLEVAAFDPGWIDVFINPFYLTRKSLHRHIKELGSSITGVTLDIGCGTKPYEPCYRSSDYIGLEHISALKRPRIKADCFYNGVTIPFADASFDAVVANEVFEHVKNPEQLLGEINRVLDKQGLFFMTVPFVWDEHEQPNDYQRFTSFGIRSLLEQHHYAIIEQRKSLDDVRVLFQLINAYLYKTTFSQYTWLNLLITVLFMSPWNILGELLYRVLPSNPDLYLDNIVLARKVK